MNTIKDKKESLSNEKIESFKQIVIGNRVFHFTHYLKSVPTPERFEQLVGNSINSVIFDLDGTLLPPYAEADEATISLLKSYQEHYTVVIFSNSPHSQRLVDLEDLGFNIAKSSIGKPSQNAFQNVCDCFSIDREKCAMVGNFPVTDMPLVGRSDEPFFHVNILIESIPPKKSLIASWSKYFRALSFHYLAVAITKIVLVRNRELTRDIAKFKP